MQAEIDLLWPTGGVRCLVCDGAQLPNFRVLAVFPAGLPSGRKQETLVESYVRGSDLVATYKQTPDRDIRPQVYWRFLSDNGYGGIEVIVSVQTDLLHSRPALHTSGQYGASQVLRLEDVESMSFRVVEQASVARPEDGASLFLIRPETHPNLSYAEMVHPSDFVKADIYLNVPGGTELRHDLFPESLEKGVIRRARLRSYWLARRGDEELAAKKYQQLIKSSPPLTA